MLPVFKGSLLRGTFGNALRKTVCSMGPQQSCSSCFLNRSCVYARVFESFIHDTPPPFLQGIRTAPRPYILECPSTQRHWVKDSVFRFDLILIGSETGSYANCIAAVRQLCRSGLGSRRQPLVLEGVAFRKGQSWIELFDGQKDSWLSEAQPEILRPEPEDSVSEATLHFRTPVRIRNNGKLVDDIGIRQLTAKMLRRVYELAYFYVPGSNIDWNFEPWLEQCAAIDCVERDIHWHSLDRYSSRQQQSMPFGGFVGHLRLRGELRHFMPLWRLAEVLHVGKGTTFGLGMIELKDLAEKGHHISKDNSEEQ